MSYQMNEKTKSVPSVDEIIENHQRAKNTLGVTYSGHTNTWRARMTHKGAVVLDNEYDTYEEALKARKEVEDKYKSKDTSPKMTKQYRTEKATVKRFILKSSTEDDIDLVEEWLKERQQQKS